MNAGRVHWPFPWRPVAARDAARRELGLTAHELCDAGRRRIRSSGPTATQPRARDHLEGRAVLPEVARRVEMIELGDIRREQLEVGSRASFEGSASAISRNLALGTVRHFGPSAY